MGKQVFLIAILGLVWLFAGIVIGRLTVKAKPVEVAAKPDERPTVVFWDANDPGEMRLGQFLKSPYLPGRMRTSPATLSATRNDRMNDPEPVPFALSLVALPKAVWGEFPRAEAGAPPFPLLDEGVTAARPGLLKVAPAEVAAGPRVSAASLDPASPPIAPAVSQKAPEWEALRALGIPACVHRLAHSGFPASVVRAQPVERLGLLPAFSAAEWASRQGSPPERAAPLSPQPPWPDAFAEVPAKARVDAPPALIMPGAELVHKRRDATPEPQGPKTTPASLTAGQPAPIQYRLPAPGVVSSGLPVKESAEEALLAGIPARKLSHRVPAAARPGAGDRRPEPVWPARGTLAAKRAEIPAGSRLDVEWLALPAPVTVARGPSQAGPLPGLYAPAKLLAAPAPESAPALPSPVHRLPRLPPKWD
jgi:hypothetical protein